MKRNWTHIVGYTIILLILLLLLFGVVSVTVDAQSPLDSVIDLNDVTTFITMCWSDLTGESEITHVWTDDVPDALKQAISGLTAPYAPVYIRGVIKRPGDGRYVYLGMNDSIFSAGLVILTAFERDDMFYVEIGDTERNILLYVVPDRQATPVRTLITLLEQYNCQDAEITNA